METIAWLCGKLIRFFAWFFLLFLLPSLMIIVGGNIFLAGVGATWSIPYNSLTFLGLWVIRAALPVTPASKPFTLLPLGHNSKATPEEIDALLKDIEKELDEEEQRIDQIHRDIADQTGWTKPEDKKDDGSSGPSDPGSK